MTLLVGLLEIGNGELGVVLHGRQRLVTQDVFDVVHVGSAPEEFGCTTPPQGVGGNSDIKLCLLGVPESQLSQDMVREARSVAVEEQGRFVRGFDQVWADGFDVGFKEAHCRLAGRNVSLLIPLPRDDECRVVEVDVADIHVEHFSGTEAAGVKKLQHGAIAVAFRTADLHPRKQFSCFFMREYAGRQKFGRFDIMERGGQRLHNKPPFSQELEEGADAADDNVDGAGLNR